MKFATIFTIAIIGSIYAQTTNNCSGGTATLYCVNCVASNCVQCYGGFVDAGKCKAPTTAVSNCWSYTDATNCSNCMDGYYFPTTARSGADTCKPYTGLTSPTVPTTQCALYTRVTDSTVKCDACKSGLATAGATATGITTCTSAGMPSNCAAVLFLTDPAPAPSGRRVLAAGDNKCVACNAGFILNSTNNVCGADTTNPGCAVWDGTTCAFCRPTTHQMAETNKCSAKPAGAYSAILSVVSMIVALMFANF